MHLAMFATLLVHTARRSSSRGVMAVFRHLGPLGLFSLAILDSSPLPTFAGADILTAILAASHRNLWYEYAAVATAGSLIGACITFSLARRAGIAYVNSRFGQDRVATLLEVFQNWGTGVLAISTAVPFPFPTSALFAAAGVSGYGYRKFFATVALCRAARYSLIGILAANYGRRFVRFLRRPDQYWGWLLLFAAIIAVLVATGVTINRRLQAALEYRVNHPA